MSNSKITMLAFNAVNNNLFSELILPEGIDKDVLIDNILLEGAEFEVLYSNPNFMQHAIGLWSKKNYRTFEKWINALNIEYNPLENYDRIEDWIDNTSSNKKEEVNIESEGRDTSNYRNSGSSSSESTNETSQHNDNDTENKVSAFDSSTYQNADTSSSSSNQTGNSAGTDVSSNAANGDTESNSTMKSSNETTDKVTTENIRSGRAHGNIGVTTSQQMLASELDIATWNLYGHITDLFLNEFCIMIYI